MGRYVADLYAHEVKLVIEIDGAQHSLPHQSFYDQDRTEILENYGITLIRFPNDDVLNFTENVLEVIREAIVRLRELKKKSKH